MMVADWLERSVSLTLQHFFLSGGQHHTLILTNDNKCYAIGRKDYGRLGVGEIPDEQLDKLTLINKLGELNIVQLDCGECCSFAVTDDGKAFSWGMGSNQQLGVGSDDDQYEPLLLTGAQVRERQVIRISSGGQHTLFLAADKVATTNGNHKSAEPHSITNGKVDGAGNAEAKVAVTETKPSDSIATAPDTSDEATSEEVTVAELEQKSDDDTKPANGTE